MIDLHKALGKTGSTLKGRMLETNIGFVERQFPTTQFLWHPSTNGQKYRCNVSMNNSTEAIVEEVAKYCTGQDLIQLTIHGDMLYYN